jgi:hypothetical protein
MILCRQQHAAAVDKAVFPGNQGGPHMHTISGIAVALAEARRPNLPSMPSRSSKRSDWRKAYGRGVYACFRRDWKPPDLIDLRNKIC